VEPPLYNEYILIRIYNKKLVEPKTRLGAVRNANKMKSAKDVKGKNQYTFFLL
jgi:hypothetical protein